MPRSSRKRVLKIPFKSFDAEKKDPQKCASVSPKDKGVNSLKSAIPSFGDPTRPKQPSSLPRKVLDSNLGKTRIVGDILPKSTMNVFSGKLPLRSRNVTVNKLPTRDTSLLNKKVSGSRMVTEALMQKEHVAPGFLSILMNKGRLIRNKVATQLVGRKVWWDGEEAKRLPHAKRLQLFQALLKEPLPFLDLHVRFGASKRTIRGLVKKGFLTEMWGRKAIGVRFKLTNKGKTSLKELEAAAECESRIREKNLIRLKHRT